MIKKTENQTLQEPIYEIFPSVGVARLGNSDEFCLVPDTIGGLPSIFVDEFSLDTKKVKNIEKFKDREGKILRQGQLFRIMKTENGVTTEIDLNPDSNEVESFEWKVHLANKKSAWYKYSELRGNLMLGEHNSYANRGISLRNANITLEEDRKKLLIDPGYRTLNKCNDSKSFDFNDYNKEFEKSEYKAQFLEKNIKDLFQKYKVEYMTAAPIIKSLGDIKTDKYGNLIVLGGFGRTSGSNKIDGYGGADNWWDDISDGPVTCKIKLKDKKEPIVLTAWIIVGSPDFAPQITNISTLSDTMIDVGIRFKNLCPQMINQTEYKNFNIKESFVWEDKYWNKDYHVEYYRDIKPIFDRMRNYQWVANVQPMINFSQFSDNDLINKNADGNKLREEIFSFFRENDKKPPLEPGHEGYSSQNIAEFPQETLFKNNAHDDLYHPLMPLNSGSNSVRNQNIQKFLALDRTQMFCLEQWSKGKFHSHKTYKSFIDEKHQVSVGNCNGLPMSPGIEVTWSVQNPNIYDKAFKIAHAKVDPRKGLSLDRDECAPDNYGCEPGDLTKRMACPWQADFVNCTIQNVNFNDFNSNKDDKLTPITPTYHVYWWPPQSPWDVLTGDFDPNQQKEGHLPSGLQVNFQRGLVSYDQMVAQWHSLGFIRNLNLKPDSDSKSAFPFFVETERNHEVFEHKTVNTSSLFGDDGIDDENPLELFYLKEEFRPKAVKVESDNKQKVKDFTSKVIDLVAEQFANQKSNISSKDAIFNYLSKIEDHNYLTICKNNIEDELKDTTFVRITSVKNKFR